MTGRYVRVEGERLFADLPVASINPPLSGAASEGAEGDAGAAAAVAAAAAAAAGAAKSAALKNCLFQVMV